MQTIKGNITDYTIIDYYGGSVIPRASISTRSSKLKLIIISISCCDCEKFISISSNIDIGSIQGNHTLCIPFYSFIVLKA